jgi:hypothetical protein
VILIDDDDEPRPVERFYEEFAQRVTINFENMESGAKFTAVLNENQDYYEVRSHRLLMII